MGQSINYTTYCNTWVPSLDIIYSGFPRKICYGFYGGCSKILHNILGDFRGYVRLGCVFVGLNLVEVIIVETFHVDLDLVDPIPDCVNLSWHNYFRPY